MKLNGSKPGYQSTHMAAGPSTAGIILLLCIYLLGAVIGCYFASGGQGTALETEDWLKFCTCMDAVFIALILLLSGIRLYPLIAIFTMLLQGFLTSVWIMWQCVGGTSAIYIRCCGECGLFSAAALLCTLVAALKGLSTKYRPGKHGQQMRTCLILMGILYAVLLIAVMLQIQVCKWL